MIFKKSYRIGLAMIVVICLILLIWRREPILVSMAQWLDVGQSPRASDYVMILPGGPERRPFVAAAMLRAGLAKGIVTVETESDPATSEGLVPTTDVLVRRILTLRGIRDDQIQVFSAKSKSTWTDALALAKFMHEHPEATVAIVTDCYHTRRSSWVFHRVLGKDAERVYFVSAPLDTVSPDTWWTTEDGLTTYLSEYSKLFFYVATDRDVMITGLGIGLLVILGYQFWRRRNRIKHACTPSSD